MNTRVDFYLISASSKDGHHRFACRLLEKAYQHRHKVLVLCQDQTQVDQIDELLWVYADTSFVPHNILGEGPTPPPPIQVGTQLADHHRDILMVLGPDIPEEFNRFRRIIIIIPNEEQAKQLAREHYRYFREKGCTLNTHDLK